MAKQDYYETLGVSRSADGTEIKKAYRKLAKKYHPDANPGDQQAEQRFKEVTEAYDVLGDPEKKKMYDLYGMAAFDGSMGAAGNAQGDPFSRGGFSSGFGGNEPYREYHYSSGNVNDADLEEMLKHVFGDMFGSFGDGSGRSYRDRFGRGYRSYAGNSEGFGGSYTGGRDWHFGGSDSSRDFGGWSAGTQSCDLHAEITISLKEAAHGCEKLLHLKGAREERLQVHIPAGIGEGQSVRLKGKGHPCGSGSLRGDLYIKVHIQADPVYQRKGMDIYTTVSIPYETAKNGGEAYVQTLYGTVKCRIPAGIRSGGKIRLKNKGMVSMKNAGVYGDEYVTIQVQS